MPLQEPTHKDMNDAPCQMTQAEGLAWAQGYNRAIADYKKLMLELRTLRHYEERLALCPDHRDKATGRCIVCQAEQRTRNELRRNY